MALPTLRIIGFVIGIFLITLAISMAVPMLTLVIYDHLGDLPSFLWASLITFVAGLALVLPGRPEQVHLRWRSARTAKRNGDAVVFGRAAAGCQR